MYELCMVYKCISCPEKLNCDDELKKERLQYLPLMYKPFENLKEILEMKYDRSR